MAYIFVSDFRHGLDRRRPQIAGVPGTLWDAQNVVINRGGDVVRAKKFVSTYTLPSGTFGLSSLKGQLWVFGSASTPGSLPVQVQYQRLQAGGTRATGSVTITGGTASAGVNKVTQVTVNGVDLLTAAVDWTTSHADTATALASAINGNTDASGYTAVANSATVTITAVLHGTGPNGFTVSTTNGGDVTTSTANMAGGTTATMVRVHDVDTFDGKFYVIAEFDDGGIYHFYDGVREADWDDLSEENSSFEAVAEALALKVDANAAIRAIAVGAKVIITAVTPGTAFTCSGAATDNGTTTTPTATATQLVANVAAVAEVRATGTVEITAGSSSPGVNRITSLTVNGDEILAAPVNWVSSNAATANALAVAINNNTSASGYTASALGETVTITAAVGTGATPNGYVVDATPAGNVTTIDTNMSGGVAAVSPVAQVYQVAIGGASFDAEDRWAITVNGTEYEITGLGAGAGTSAYVHKGRLYSTARSLFRYCVLDDPTDWATTSTPADDAGFINIASDTHGNQRLVGAATYQGKTAIFARDQISIYQLFADATENVIVSALEQTGTMAPRSIIAHGNLDVYYLNDTGIRSIRSRDGYDAAYVSDVGSAIDGFVQSWMEQTDEDTLARAVAAIEPVDGVYMLAIDDRIFCLSYYPQSKITAWSYLDVGFTVEDLIRVERRLYARSGNTIYLYGGADGDTYPDADELEAVVETPFLTANDPAGDKDQRLFDVAAVNDWAIELLIDPNDTTKAVDLGTVSKITFNRGDHALVGAAAVAAVRFTCSAAGYASISSFALGFDKA
jgi:hypothetical protein